MYAAVSPLTRRPRHRSAEHQAWRAYRRGEYPKQQSRGGKAAKNAEGTKEMGFGRKNGTVML